MKLYDMLHFQGHLWTIIDLKEKYGYIIATLLLSDDSSYKRTFDEKSSGRYYGSSIEKYLREEFQLSNFVPLVSDIADEGCQARFYLLSVEEAKKLPQSVLNNFRTSWWLRTIGNRYGSQSYIGKTGIKYDANKVYDLHGLRPAMQVRVEDIKILGGIIIPSFDITDQDWSIE